MFTRMAECHVKAGRRQEARIKMNSEVLPILQSQPGFVDLIRLIDEYEPERLVAISLWKTKEDAQRYDREHFSQVAGLLQPFLTDTPKTSTYSVDSSTTHNIAAGKAT